jgi:hypothetical protein
MGAQFEHADLIRRANHLQRHPGARVHFLKVPAGSINRDLDVDAAVLI